MVFTSNQSNFFPDRPRRIFFSQMLFTIPQDELSFRASSSGGPGGQHVNRTATKVTVMWDVANSTSLSHAQRRRLMNRLANRIDTTGVLRVAAAERRSQLQNRDMAIRRMNRIVQDALRVPKLRKKTRPPKRSIEQRLATKKHRSATKEKRRPVDVDE